MPHTKVDFKLSKEKIKVLDDYLDYKRTSCKAKSKINNYNYFISLFLQTSNKSLKDYGEKELIDFLNKYSKHYSVGTMNEVRWMLKGFVCWYYEDFSKRFRNLDRILAQQKTEKTYSPEQMLSKEDVEKLVQEEPETRWKAFFLLYFYGGFRPGEVCKLKWNDITFDNEGCYIKVISQKNHREFQKYIPEDVCFYLRKLKERNYESEYVFPTKRKHWNTTKKDKKRISVGDKPQTTSGVYQHLVPLAKRVLNKHINPYILRHSIATILYNRDDLKDDDVAQQMGHSREMKNTYNNLSLEKIRARMKKIYIKPELTAEQRNEYDKKISELKNIMMLQSKVITGQINQKEYAKELVKKLNELEGSEKYKVE